MDGDVKLHRKICQKDLWLEEPFTKGQAWVDMILLASHRDTSFSIRGVKVNLKRGQLGWSEVKLSERWRWSRNKVRRFLRGMEMEQQIEQQKNGVTSIITLKNYDLYQMPGSKRNSKRNTFNNSSSSRTTKKEKIYKKEKDFVFQNGQLERWEKFTTWADKQNFDLIARLDPITPQQLFTLAENYGSKAVVDILLAMENHKPITKNKSIYLTANNWLRRNEEKNV